jgi:hypothetical protein
VTEIPDAVMLISDAFERIGDLGKALSKEILARQTAEKTVEALKATLTPASVEEWLKMHVAQLRAQSGAGSLAELTVSGVLLDFRERMAAGIGLSTDEKIPPP